jgi:hypothetical protein
VVSVGSTAIFLGPTLSVADARNVLDAEYLPPVQLGDVWRISQERPRAIGIIDGYFHHVPAVWHKEILYAMSLGIAVYGSASMGALRAAELSPFGMIGVGEIAERYLSGILSCDDEVALIHAPGEYGYQSLSEPLVNIRATLHAARLAGIIPANTAESLLAAARSLYYPDRTWPRVFSSTDAPHEELSALDAWLPAGRVDQKRADALAMLERMGVDRAAANGPPQPVRGTFAPTVLWHEFVRRETPLGAVLDEFLLHEPLSAGVREAIRRAHRGEHVDWYRVLAAQPEWPNHCRRARLKCSTATARESEPSAADAETLFAWFFAERLGWPNNLADFLLTRGWSNPSAVLRVAAREANFLNARTGDPFDSLAPSRCCELSPRRPYDG